MQVENLRETGSLIANPDGEAFCCSKPINVLVAEGSNGTVEWIAKFKDEVNKIGEPLQLSLLKPNHFWYEMKADTVADLVAMVNYGNTLKVVKMNTRSFVNQRLIRFTAKDHNIEVDLCHALMNSHIGLFYIEALGFGRGMGALDLNSTKLRDGYFILDLKLISEAQKQEILKAFDPIAKRHIEHLTVELTLKDRIYFEETVALTFGINHISEKIKEALLSLYLIRTTVK